MGDALVLNYLALENLKRNMAFLAISSPTVGMYDIFHFYFIYKLSTAGIIGSSKVITSIASYRQFGPEECPVKNMLVILYILYLFNLYSKCVSCGDLSNIRMGLVQPAACGCHFHRSCYEAHMQV